MLHLIHIDTGSGTVVAASEDSYTARDTIHVIGSRFIVGGRHGSLAVAAALDCTKSQVPATVQELIRSVNSVIDSMPSELAWNEAMSRSGMFVIDVTTLDAFLVHGSGTVTDLWPGDDEPVVTVLVSDEPDQDPVTEYIRAPDVLDRLGTGSFIDSDAVAGAISGMDQFRHRGVETGPVTIFVGSRPEHQAPARELRPWEHVSSNNWERWRRVAERPASIRPRPGQRPVTVAVLAPGPLPVAAVGAAFHRFGHLFCASRVIQQYVAPIDFVPAGSVSLIRAGTWVMEYAAAGDDIVDTAVIDARSSTRSTDPVRVEMPSMAPISV